MGPRVFWFWFWFQSSGFVSWFWFRAGPESMKLLLLHALREGRGLHHVREGGGEWTLKPIRNGHRASAAICAAPHTARPQLRLMFARLRCRMRRTAQIF